MSRTGKIKKRVSQTDPIYGNKLLARFINGMMKSGKKSTAEKMMYTALERVKSQNLDPLATFQNALQNVGPKIEVRPKRVGGASYQVPTEVRGERRISLAIRWLISAARNRPNKQYHTFAEKLSAEILDANKNLGEAVKKKDMMHRNAEANKAFSHFRW